MEIDPNDGGGNNWITSKAIDSFKTWVMYKPPAVGSQPVTWIPMSSYTWHWNGTANYLPPWALDGSEDGQVDSAPAED
jgi:hypothetical protein